MQRIIQLLLVTATVIAVAAILHAQPYYWLTNDEMPRLGSPVSFWSGDTLEGPVHSNSIIRIMQSPVFLDNVSTTASDFWRGPGYNPVFEGRVSFNTRPVLFPDFAGTLRRCATQRGHYYSQNQSYYVRLMPGRFLIASWTKGQPMDTLSHVRMEYLYGPTCIYVNGPLYICGLVGGEVSVGASEDIHIVDDLRYADTDNRGRWINPEANHTNYLGLVSEHNVIIDNTPANGRGNSSGRGNNQTNLDSTSVVVTASVVALGESFTFDQQNDPDSGYVCDCSPDDRGYIYFRGAVIQTRRGYTHRSNRSSTGYLMNMHYDRRLFLHNPPGFPSFANQNPPPDTVNFGDVVVGQTAADTIAVDASQYGALSATYPFTVQRLHPNDYYYDGTVVVRFSPPRAQMYSGTLTVGTVDGRIVQHPIRGRGIQGAPPLALDVSPNPFNLTTTLRYSVPDGQSGKMRMFDILGRTVHEFDLTGKAGQQAISFNGSMLATGVYFVRLEAAGQVVTQKVLLLK
jgi:hypothetical protein